MRQLKQIMVMASLIAGIFSASQAQVSWTVRNPSPPMKSLQSVVWTGDRLVGVGDSGSVATSPNGSYWTVRTAPTTTLALTSVAFSGGTFVAVGAGGLIRSSPDGINWTVRTSGVSTTLNFVVWTGVRFVAGGASGAIITSTDGATWSVQTTGSTATLRAMAWNGSFAVVVGDGGALLTSADGITWTARTSGTTTAMYGINWAAANNQFVVVGNTGLIRTSPDGITWTTQGAGTTTNYLNSVTWTGTLYAAVGGTGTIITSPDGITWTVRTSGTTEAFRSVIWTTTRLLAVGTNGIMRASTSGTTWASPALTTAGLNGVAWATGKLRVIAADGGALVTSNDDTSWVLRASGSSNGLYSVAWGTNSVVAVGNAGTIVSSADGEVWTVRTSGTSNLLNSVAWSGGTFAAVGASGEIRTSSDGTTWTQRTSGTTVLIYSVAWCGTQFVAVGAGGLVLTSPNGTTWTSRISGSTAVLRGVAYTGSQVVVVGAGGVLLTSPDGITWTSRTSGTTSVLYSVAWNGTSLTATGAGGLLLTSVDALTWTPQVSGITGALYASAGAGTSWVVVGAGGTLLTSPLVALPGPPTLQLPANTGTGVSVFGPLVWDPVSGATSYRFQVATDSNFVGIIVNDTTNATSRSISGLTSFTTYYWRVKSQNQLGGGAYSAFRKFTTGQAPTQAPPAPVLVSPALFATNVVIPATLTWNSANGAETYQLQISTSFTFATVLLDDSTLTSTTRAYSGLTGGSSYYWRVRAKNGLGKGEWSETWNFTAVLAPPDKPVLVSPAPFATSVSRNVAFNWDSAFGAQTYHIQVAVDAGFLSIVANDSGRTTRTYVAPITFVSNTDYYWRVRGKNGAGVGEWSSIARFTTGTTAIRSGAFGALGAQFFRVGGSRYLRYSLNHVDRVTMRIYDMHGRQEAVVIDKILAPGTHTITLPSNLSNALHLVEFRTGADRQWLTLYP